MRFNGIEACPKCGAPVRHTAYPQCHFFECKGCEFFMQLSSDLTSPEAIDEFNRRVKL